MGGTEEKKLTQEDEVMSKPFLVMAMPLPDGKTRMLELDKAAAAEALVEMEKWGDDCSEDSKTLRDALRSELKKHTEP